MRDVEPLLLCGQLAYGRYHLEAHHVTRLIQIRSIKALLFMLVLVPSVAQAQGSNVPPAAQRVEEDVEDAVRRFRVGVTGGVALDPELIDVGAHVSFGPIFTPRLQFRPGIEVGIGELTTLFGINLDVLYDLPGGGEGWRPYVGAGPNFALSRRSFETEDLDNIDGVIVTPTDDPDRNRFDFSDTDFNGGFNFAVGARSRGGAFFEMKATAWGVSMIRLLGGFNF